MSINICDVCKKSFTTKYGLNKHIKRSDVCATIRELNNKITTLTNENTHLSQKCLELEVSNNESNVIITDLTNRINVMEQCEQFYKDKYDVMMEKATSKTNNVTNNIIIETLTPVDLDTLDGLHEFIENWTDDDMIRGPYYLAFKLSEEVLKQGDNIYYGVTDTSRNIGVFLDDKTGCITRDPQMRKLRSILTPITKQAREQLTRMTPELGTDVRWDNVSDIYQLVHNGKKFCLSIKNNVPNISLVN